MISIALVGLTIAVSLASECSIHIDRSRFESNKYVVDYDLYPLVNSDRWVVKESDPVARNYTYIFNLCKSVKTIPKNCRNKTDNEHYPAYQIDEKYGGCYHLGRGTESADVRWSPIDMDDPTTGVTYQYIGGDENNCGGIARSLRLSFFCMNNPSSLPKEGLVVEYPQCTYNIQLESMYGCPINCGEFSNKLCGGTGICGYDRDLQKARCFCNKGYYGSACEKEGSGLTVVNSTSEILFFISGFLVIVEIGVIIMWKKVKGLRLDPAAYANLNKEKMGMI